jgi:hypothetical protein
VWIIRAKQLRLGFNRRARGLRYFRLVSGGANHNGAAGEEEGAIRDPGPDDAVER